jgi:hypothetical protein
MNRDDLPDLSGRSHRSHELIAIKDPVYVMI